MNRGIVVAGGSAVLLMILAGVAPRGGVIRADGVEFGKGGVRFAILRVEAHRFQLTLDLHSGVPVYRQIIDQVRAGMASGVLQRPQAPVRTGGLSDERRQTH